MAEERREPLRAELKYLAGEIEHLRATMGDETTRLAGLIGKLAAEVEERIRPEDVERVRRMVSEMSTLVEGLMLPWRKQISEEMEARALWAGRIERGEAELVNRVEGKYAIYESYHHLPSCETFVRTVPLPYTYT